MKTQIIKNLSIALSGIIVCSSLSGCGIFGGGSGTSTPETVIELDTPSVSFTPEVQTNEPEPTEAASTPEITETPEPVQTEQAETMSPVETPVPVPATPGASGKVSFETNGKPTRFTMPTDLYGLSEKMTESWFSDAAFVGDSITIGWKNYNNLMLDFFGQTRFFCEGGYGVGHALDPISDTSIHPVFAGEQHLVWDILNMTEAKKVFLLLGMNDLTLFGVNGTAEKYEQVIDEIRAHVPGIQIYVISAMYMYRGSERDKLNNANIFEFNKKLVDICSKKGIEFINIASHLIDEDGFLTDEYCSDKYVHQTYKAYAVWGNILRSLAARHLKAMPPVEFELP